MNLSLPAINAVPTVRFGKDNTPKTSYILMLPSYPGESMAFKTEQFLGELNDFILEQKLQDDVTTVASLNKLGILKIKANHKGITVIQNQYPHIKMDKEMQGSLC